MSEQPYDPSITDDDRLWAALAYALSPLIPVIILLMENKKERPYLKQHNGQALVLGLVNVALSVVLGWTIVLSCVPLLVWFYMVYLGIQAYQGNEVSIPVITDFVKKQGWA